MFTWEVSMNIDLLANLFDEKRSIVNSRCEIQNKEQYLNILRSGNFIHDSITVERSVATVKKNTATVIGKSRFVMTLASNKLRRHLSYMEVFIKDEKRRLKTVVIKGTTGSKSSTGRWRKKDDCHYSIGIYDKPLKAVL